MNKEDHLQHYREQALGTTLVFIGLAIFSFVLFKILTVNSIIPENGRQTGGISQASSDNLS